MKEIVTTSADSGDGSLRQAILDINSYGGTHNEIQLKIAKNTPIVSHS